MATAPTLPATQDTSSAEPLARGATFGRYVIVDVLGEGGMGKVFAAHDASLGRNIALKVVHHPHREAQSWLVREARAMARVQHPAIVAVHDIGAVGERVYIAMELVRGTTLRRWLDDATRNWRDIVTMFVAAGRGLEAAHAAGVVHRDFKPENVLVDETGRVRVSDFGIADLRDERGPVPSAGTPWYMAPEQYARRGTDERSDQFSFCVALWHAVYGVHPFTDVQSELASAVVAGVVRAPPDRAPRWLATALRRGLAVDPAARFPSLTALLATLERRLGGRRWIGTAVAAIVAAGAAGTVMVASRHDGPSCAVAGAHAAEVWTPMRRGQIVAALQSTELSVSARVIAEIDRYVGAWSEQRVEACRATNERGEQSGELLDLRMHCLDRRLAELDALVGVLAGGERGVVASAATAVGGLVPLTACADVQALRDVVQLPPGPAVRARVEAVRAALSRERADYATGRFARGLAAIQPLAREAEAIGYAPLVAEVELDHGVLAWRADKMDEAETALYHAIANAEAGRDGATAARAWVELLQFIGQERRQPEEAWRLGTIARGAVERYAGDPALSSELADQLGDIALDLGKLDDAQRELERAYAERRAHLPDDSPPLGASLEHLAMLATARGDHATALADHARSLAILERAFGANHPDTLSELGAYASAYYEAGKLDAALAMYRDGFARVQRTLGGNGIDAGSYLHNIALVESRQGDHVDAIEKQRRAVAIFTAVRGPLAPDTVEERADLARMLRVAHLDGAVAEYRAVLPQIEQAYGRDSESTAVTLAGLGRALFDSGHKREAIDMFERALALREHLGNADETAKARADLDEARR